MDSLVNQTIDDIEIILVNDCSTDNSLNILKEYEKKYEKKIILIDLEKNLGPGGARNRGIEKASGEYIGFVDSDDYVETEMYEKMYEIAKSGDYDMVDCAYKNKHTLKDCLNIEEDVWGTLDVDKRKKLVINPGYMWSKIIKKDIFEKNNLKFRENSKYEDIDFGRLLCMYVNKVYGCRNIYYHYEYNDNSITNSSNMDIQIDGRMEAIISLIDEFKSINEYDTYKEEIDFLVYATYADMIKLYSLEVDPEKQTYECYKKLRDFFFKFIGGEYNKNKYIEQLDKKKIRMYAELNNADYRLILDTLNKK